MQRRRRAATIAAAASAAPATHNLLKLHKHHLAAAGA